MYCLALWSGLFGNKDLAQKLFGLFSYFFKSIGLLYSSGLASSSGMDLGLENVRRVDLSGC